MSTAKQPRDYIPSRWITYHYICRNCGKSDVGEFDKFKEPKQQWLLCQDCQHDLNCDQYGNDNCNYDYETDY